MGKIDGSREGELQYTMKLQRPASSAELVSSFDEAVDASRSVIVENLQLNPEQASQLDAKLAELKKIVKENADKLMTSIGYVGKVRFRLEVSKNRTKLEDIIKFDLDEMIKYLRINVKGLKSIKDYPNHS